IRRRGQRNEDRGFSGCGYFCDRARAGTAKQKVSPAKELRHIVDKGKNFRGNTRLGIGLACLIIIALASLMNETKGREPLPQKGQTTDHRAIDRPRSLASAEN